MNSQSEFVKPFLHPEKDVLFEIGAEYRVSKTANIYIRSTRNKTGWGRGLVPVLQGLDGAETLKAAHNRPSSRRLAAEQAEADIFGTRMLFDKEIRLGSIHTGMERSLPKQSSSFQ